MLENNELEGTWKEAVVAQFKSPSRHLPGGTGITGDLSQDSWSPGRDLNLGTPEYEARMITLGRDVQFYLFPFIIGSNQLQTDTSASGG
jgi:hypothetical protein